MAQGNFNMPYGSQEQPSQSFSNAATCREEDSHGYPTALSMDHGSSRYGMNDFPSPGQESATGLPEEQAALYGGTHVAMQLPDFDCLMPTGPQIGMSSPQSSVMSGGLSPQPFIGSFSPQNNPATMHYTPIQPFTAPTFDDPVLSAEFGTMLSLNNEQSPSFGYPTQPEPGFETSYAQRGATSYPPPNLPARANGALYNRSIPTNVAMSFDGRMSPLNTQLTTNAQQPSPALSGSPSAMSSSGGPSQTSRMVSPTVRIDYYGREESPHGSRLDRTSSKRSHGSKKAHTHLSPYPDDVSSSDDDNDTSKARQTLRPPKQSQRATTPRHEDGSWATARSRLSGLSPEERSRMADQLMPTLDEIQAQRILAETSVKVEKWLSKSEIGSEAGDDEAQAPTGRRSNRSRAKSTNDAAASGLGLQLPTLQIPSIPGPGVYINEPSTAGEDDDEDESSEPESPVAVIAPVTEQQQLVQDDSSSSIHSRPWADPETLVTSQPADSRDQPSTANAAIMRFKQRAQEIDGVSVTATLGSRRRSESDMGSIVHAAGVSKPVQRSHNSQSGRRGTLLNSIRDNILPHRGNSNKMKRKGSQVEEGPKPDEKLSRSSTDQSLTAPKRVGSFGRPKSPRLDTNVAGVVHAARSPAGIVAQAKQYMRRSRSRSDLAKSPKSPGLADLWTRAGGPPVANLATSPATPSVGKTPAHTGADDDSGDEADDGPDGIVMDLAVRTDMVVRPTYDGFKFQIQELNPRLNHYLLERLTQEQLKRYKRLLEAMMKHSQSVAVHKCPSKAFCFQLGGESKSLPPRAGMKDSETTLVGFQIMLPGMSEEDLERATDGQVVPAQFPSGVPLPPVKRLPAEFECPLCFRVKKFYKPSDWTKHVHEDIQPFTCTFPNCSEPKSFKRKADWVRHENERHRQLECWTCDIGECSHTCYRKDNFVQHLVREHKVPEPKVRTGRSGGSRSPLTPLEPSDIWRGLSVNTAEPTEEDVWALVERCRKDASKHPRDEPCKFCGNICNTWKKLTVHLAKHMEQISMPVLPLIEQKRLMSDAPLYQPTLQQPQPVPILSTMSPEELPTGLLCDEPGEMDTTMPELAINGVSSQMMQTYPPPSFTSYGFDATNNSMLGPTPNQFVGQSFPPIMVPQRQRSSSFNDVAGYSAADMRQGTTYPPAQLPSRTISPASMNTHMDPQQSYLATQNNFTSPATSGWGESYMATTEGGTEEYMPVQQAHNNRFRG